MSKTTHATKSGALVPEVASLLRTIDGQLYFLGWSRQHPRIVNFVCELNKKHTFLNLVGLEQVPLKYLQKLSEFLQIYFRCHSLLPKLGLSWESPIIAELTAEYGGYDKMPILGWHHLYESLENEYFLMDMPLSDKSTTKTNVK